MKKTSSNNEKQIKIMKTIFKIMKDQRKIMKNNEKHLENNEKIIDTHTHMDFKKKNAYRVRNPGGILLFI